jgi:hypothetical protein
MLAVVYVLFLNPVFQTTPLHLAQWELIVPLLLIPSVVAEVAKILLNRRARRKTE